MDARLAWRRRFIYEILSKLGDPSIITHYSGCRAYNCFAFYGPHLTIFPHPPALGEMDSIDAGALQRPSCLMTSTSMPCQPGPLDPPFPGQSSVRAAAFELAACGYISPRRLAHFMEAQTWRPCPSSPSRARALRTGRAAQSRRPSTRGTRFQGPDDCTASSAKLL